MNIKTVCLGVLAASVIAGSAFAGILDQPKMMAPFFTDKAMTTMKSDADMKKVWDKESKRHKSAMMKECNDAAMSKPHAEFCDKLHTLAGKG
ncbi:hypothetical protein LGH82_29705 [Mesorhizobium sp. PAMC28654]|uniref:hypothetical protein n=1 Tax=Mesorhizobium sp. PAMC28654 TaxID=2880934 RepID=UPI001D09F5E1|nr:hypothetical protein [Mesorhizobium sp. PAMC28654]UDL89199.1 hypothetical protein LGH82_29705 [Mesorhizobium sp. PAMC28654]